MTNVCNSQQDQHLLHMITPPFFGEPSNNYQISILEEAMISWQRLGSCFAYFPVRWDVHLLNTINSHFPIKEKRRPNLSSRTQSILLTTNYKQTHKLLDLKTVISKLIHTNRLCVPILYVCAKVHVFVHHLESETHHITAAGLSNYWNVFVFVLTNW